MSIWTFIWVAVGGAVGTLARFSIGLFASQHWGEAFPWGTLLINVGGSFAIGIFGALSLAGGPLEVAPNLRLFVTVGLCGGFTTFSTFSLQTVVLAQQGALGRAGLNAALSFVLCLVATWAGLAAGGAFNLWSHR